MRANTILITQHKYRHGSRAENNEKFRIFTEIHKHAIFESMCIEFSCHMQQDTTRQKKISKSFGMACAMHEDGCVCVYASGLFTEQAKTIRFCCCRCFFHPESVPWFQKFSASYSIVLVGRTRRQTNKTKQKREIDILYKMNGLWTWA